MELVIGKGQVSGKPCILVYAGPVQMGVQVGNDSSTSFGLPQFGGTDYVMVSLFLPLLTNVFQDIPGKAALRTF